MAFRFRRHNDAIIRTAKLDTELYLAFRNDITSAIESISDVDGFLMPGRLASRILPRQLGIPAAEMRCGQSLLMMMEFYHMMVL